MVALQAVYANASAGTSVSVAVLAYPGQSLYVWGASFPFASTVTCTDSLSRTYTLGGSNGQEDTVELNLYYLDNAGGSATVTYTDTGAQVGVYIEVWVLGLVSNAPTLAYSSFPTGVLPSPINFFPSGISYPGINAADMFLGGVSAFTTNPSLAMSAFGFGPAPNYGATLKLLGQAGIGVGNSPIGAAGPVGFQSSDASAIFARGGIAVRTGTNGPLVGKAFGPWIWWLPHFPGPELP
jgi:hypothetical protein